MDDIFLMQNYFPYKDGIYDLLGNDFVKKLKELSVSEVYTYNDEELDYISWKVWGIEDAYWIIGLYNDIIDPYNITTDTILIPSLDDVIDFLQNYKMG